MQVSTVVLNVSETIMQEIKQKYNRYHIEQTPTGSVFFAKTPSCTITGYRSGKVLFQGKKAEEEASQWKSVATTKRKKADRKPVHNWSPPNNIGELSIIGSDEVGTGDYFGPLTVAAVFVAKDQVPLLTELGVKDSKHLSDAKIKTMAKKIVRIVPCSLLILHNEKYNQMQKNGMTQGKMKALLHNRVLLNVKEKIADQPFDGILIDQFAHPDVYFRHISAEKEQVTSVYFATNAEQMHLSVAAASILARYAFLKELDKLSKRYNLELPKGAGKRVDQAATILIEENGEATLQQCAKFHFANTDKARRLVEERKKK